MLRTGVKMLCRAGQKGSHRQKQETRAPTALVVTGDADLVRRIRALGPPGWDVIACGSALTGREALRERNARLIVVDDEVLEESESGWLLDRLRQRAQGAGIVYIASQHTPELERSVRAHGVLWYTSRPLDFDRFERVLRMTFEAPGAETVGR